MNEENKEKTLFFPNLDTVKKAINAKEFEKEIIQIEIEWNKIIDATIEALTKQTVLSQSLCRKITTYAFSKCDGNPKVFIELVESWEFIITELLSNSALVEKDNNISDFF